MQRLLVGIIALALLVVSSGTAAAQAKTVSSEMRVETGVVETIDPATRSVTFKKADGTYLTTVAGPEVKRFAELKVGDKVTARYLENLVIRVLRPGESEGVSSKKGTTGSDTALPGGTKARQVTITATISAINPEIPSITFTGPNGLKYTSKVQDPAALAKVKVGDKVEIVWTEALLVSLERAS